MLNVKKDFPIFNNNSDLVYLDNAATAQMPQSVIDAEDSYNTAYRTNVHRSAHPLAERATDAFENVRGDVAEFIGAEKEEIIFTSGTTAGMNMLAYMLEHSLNLKEGDGITMTVMEHHSALLPFAQLAKRSGCALSSIPMNDAYALDLRQLATYITPKTKIVVVAFSSNVLGTVNDVRAIAERAHQVGAPLLVDAAGAAGHIPIDVTKLDCDFLTFSGHKMCAPTGVGVLYGKKAFLEKLEPSMYGGGMVQAISDGVPMFADVPARFEAGTPNISGVIGLGEAVRYVTAFGVENVHAHVRELTEYAITQLDSLEGVTLYTQRETKQNTGVISFTVAGIHPHDVAEILGRKNVAVRAGHHCAIPLMQALGQSATMRASVYLYNATDDIDRMVEAIRNAQKIFA